MYLSCTYPFGSSASPALERPLGPQQPAHHRAAAGTPPPVGRGHRPLPGRADPPRDRRVSLTPARRRWRQDRSPARLTNRGPPSMILPAPAMAPGSFMAEDMIPTGDRDARIAQVV